MKVTTNFSNSNFLMIDKNSESYIYCTKYKILIPMTQDGILDNRPFNNSPLGSMKIDGQYYSLQYLKDQHAVEIFNQLNTLKELEKRNIGKKLWLTETSKNIAPTSDRYTLYNGRTNQLEPYNSSIVYVGILKVIYGISLKNPEPSAFVIEPSAGESTPKKDAAMVPPKPKKHVPPPKATPAPKLDPAENTIKETEASLSPKIQELLDCDKNRCNLASYEKEILYDIRAGHWDIYENSQKYSAGDEKMIPRDPRKDIKRNGIIGIDFGTKSTVVVKQEGTNEIRPIRIGSPSLSVNVLERDYENPTIISCSSIDNFLISYQEKQGRPETSYNDIYVSYDAYNAYKDCPAENFYAFYPNLKQWANEEKKDVILQDSGDKRIYKLAEENSIENSTLNPIEIYAYYIGLYINNMRNGIFLKYIMSFPVKYSKATKELIRKSFENGIKKSLPNTVAEDPECMKDFSVEYKISEPAAYAVTALERNGFRPKNEKEKYLYGIFDFGGGTTDFDFGIWRGASDKEYDKYNCDYVLECFGSDSDIRLGGENILEMLAYYVFKENKNMAAEKKIACALPAGEIPFIGSENLINNSRSANANLTILKEALRPLWEQHENWEEVYHKQQEGKNNTVEKIREFSSHKGNTAKNSNPTGQNTESEYLELQMRDFSGEMTPNCKFTLNTDTLLELIKKRIQKGVDIFFRCIEKAILLNESAQHASEKVYIFPAGNSCKSAFVKEIFNATIREYNKEYEKGKSEEQDFFVLIEPLESSDMDTQYIPNAKTGVAYGLVKSRPGGKIYVRKNYETDSDTETSFKYYLGSDRRGLFNCKLSPTIKGDDGNSQTSYHIWRQFQGAGMGIAIQAQMPEHKKSV